MRLAAFSAPVLGAAVLSVGLAGPATAHQRFGGPGGFGGPPPEALSACRGASEGASCRFDGRRGAVSGTCFAPRPGVPLACRPEGGPPRFGGGPRGPGGPGGPGGRRHTATETKPLNLRGATESAAPAQVKIRIEGDSRVIVATSVPSHAVGPFPNSGNPHRITAQSFRFRVPLRPKRAAAAQPARGYMSGVAVNGVTFDPGAAEYYRGERGGGWRYEPLGGAIDLGLDASHAHVQPSGMYHYHGLPTLLLQELGVKPGRHSPIVGWAADGFPIYALYGYRDPEDASLGVAELGSGYRLKAGRRPGGREPGGRHDGTFIADYAYQGGALDACNGRFGKTPDYPDGTYAYFLTKGWPVIPRCFAGTPSDDFRKRRPDGRRF